MACVAVNSSSIKSSAAEDRCSICGSEYEEANHPMVPTNHARRTLECGHSFCYPCLTFGWTVPSRDSLVTCVLEGIIYCNLCEQISSPSCLTLEWQIWIKMPLGGYLIVQIHPMASMSDLYDRVAQKAEYPRFESGRHRFYLYTHRPYYESYSGSLLDYGIQDNSTLYLGTRPS